MSRPLAQIVPLVGVAVLLAGAARAQSPLFGGYGPRLPVYATESRERVPAWMVLPRQARIRVGDGLRFTPVDNAAVSFENLKIGVLVGALRNDGGCAVDLGARLQYVDAAWQPIGPPIPNEARVSRVEPGALLPFRFRLRTLDSAADVPPAAYVIVVESDDRPLRTPFAWDRWVTSDANDRPAATPCPPAPALVETVVTSRHTLRESFLVGGTVTLTSDTPVPIERIVITAMLRDKSGGVLEVLVGTPARRERTLADGALVRGQPVPFRLRTDIPVGRDVASIEVVTEVLPGATAVP